MKHPVATLDPITSIGKASVDPLHAITSWSGDRDGWDSDSFEDQIARSVIGLYEPAYSANIEHPVQVGADEIERLRQSGAYVSHPTRVVFTSELDAPLDSIYTGAFVHALNPLRSDPDAGTAYQRYFALKRAPVIPRPLYKVRPGTLYALLVLEAQSDGRLRTAKSFFTCAGKTITPCDFDSRKVKGWNRSTINPSTGESIAAGIVGDVTSTANFLADAAHTWTITAQEGAVRIGMGCYHEEVKSLLYARSLPLTATGRKRPILHLVAAHRRRLRSGIDVNIDEFLRGVKQVEMGGTVFWVSEPADKNMRAS